MSIFDKIVEQFPSESELGESAWYFRVKQKGKQSKKWRLDQVILDQEDEKIVIRPNPKSRSGIFIASEDIESFKIFPTPKGAKFGSGVGAQPFGVSYPRTSKGFL
jgi:hypothetical protein